MYDSNLDQSDESSFNNPFKSPNSRNAFNSNILNKNLNPFLYDHMINQGNQEINDCNPLQNPPSFLFSPLDGQSTCSATKKNLISNIIQSSDENQQKIKNFNIVKDSKIKNENLQKKRKRSKNNNIENTEKKIFGRKSKKSGEIGEHTKNSKDNMITKIKVCLMNSILVLLNNSFNFLNFNINPSQDKKFLKIDPKIYTTSKVDENIKMLDLKVKDILSNNICDKITTVDKNHNKNLIDKIYREQKENNIINILNLTFREFLDLFRGKISDELKEKLSLIKNIEGKFMNMKNFLEKVKEQEKKKDETEENINKYINNLEEMCFNYEKWFNNKK